MADKCFCLIQVADLASAEESLLQQAQIAAVNLRHGCLLLARIGVREASEHRRQLLSVSVECAQFLHEFAEIVGSEPLNSSNHPASQRFCCRACLLADDSNMKGKIGFALDTAQP